MHSSLKLFIFLILLINYNSSIEVPFPPLSGSYGVGIMDQTLKDYTRTEKLAPEGYNSTCNLPGAWHSIPSMLYYPIDQSQVSQGQKQKYISDLQVQSLIDMGMPKEIAEYIKTFQKRAVKGISISQQKSSYPVIIFTPGFGISVDYYQAIIEDIVSNGYIVMAISHPYVSGPVYLQDNNCMIPGLDIPTNKTIFDQLLEKSMDEVQLDLKFIQKMLSHINEASGFLKDKLQMYNFVVMGHSMGGMASTIYCNKVNSECKCAINFDGGSTVDTNWASVQGAWPQSNRDLKYMKFAGERQIYFDELTQEQYGDKQFYLNITDFSHSTFEDVDFIPGIVQQNVTSDEAHKIIMSNVLEFLKYSIQDEGEIVWPKEADDGHVQVITHDTFPDGFYPKNQLQQKDIQQQQQNYQEEQSKNQNLINK